MSKHVTCDSRCVVKKCKKKRNCACGCSKFMALSIGAEEICINQCNAGNFDVSSMSIEDFACKFLDAQTAYNTHGYMCKDFDPLKNSAQGLAYSQQKEDAQELSAADNDTQKKFFFVVVIVVVALLGYLFLGKSSSSSNSIAAA